MDFTLSRLKYPALVAAVGLMLGLIADLLIYDQPMGISIPIIFMLLVVAMLALALWYNAPIRVSNLWLIIPLFFLAIMFAVRAAPLLRFLNFAGALVLLLLLSNRLLNAPIIQLDLWGYAIALLESSIVSPLLSLPLIQKAINAMSASGGGRSATARRVILGLLIAAPFLLTFTALFASADLVFNRLLTDIFENFTFADIVGHTFLTLVFSALFMGGLAYTLNPPRTTPAPEPAAEATDDVSPAAVDAPIPPAIPGVKGRLGIIEALVVLFSINALFLVFVAIQFAALFGGEAFLRSQNLTYSEYARRGFFELLAVALITLSLILALDYFTGRETPRQQVFFLGGAGFMTLMTIIILASAYQRLQLYELAYGFTELRVQSHVFMIWLAILMAIFFVLLMLHRPRLFATASLLVTIGFVATLDILNQDAFIVRQNLARYIAGEELDIDYLGSLSADADPLLIPLYEAGNAEIKENLGPWLKLSLVELDRRQRDAGWPSYHLSMNRAHDLLKQYRDTLKDYEVPYSYRFLD